MATRRTRRVEALLQSELAGLLLRKIKDPRLSGLSITGVDVSPDMKQAKVYFSPLDETRVGEVLAGFQKAAPFLRRELAKRLNLKTMPRLIPLHDPSLASGAAMDALIKQVRDQDDEHARRRGDGPGEDQ